VFTELDPFKVFRSTLFLFLAIYGVLTLWSAAWRVRRLLAGTDPGKRLLRTYLAYQVVTVRLRPVGGELLQIGFWLALLVIIWWLHAKV
jgi:hypothetical protein